MAPLDAQALLETLTEALAQFEKISRGTRPGAIGIAFRIGQGPSQRPKLVLHKPRPLAISRPVSPITTFPALNGSATVSFFSVDAVS